MCSLGSGAVVVAIAAQRRRRRRVVRVRARQNQHLVLIVPVEEVGGDDEERSRASVGETIAGKTRPIFQVF